MKEVKLLAFKTVPVRKDEVKFNIVAVDIDRVEKRGVV